MIEQTFECDERGAATDCHACPPQMKRRCFDAFMAQVKEMERDG